MNGIRWRGCAFGVVALLAAGSLGACNGDNETAPTPQFSSTTAAPTTDSSSPVTASSSAAAESPEAFVRRWVMLQTQMQNIGQSEDFRLVSKRCTACDGLADIVDRYYGAGGYIKTEGWSIQSLDCNVSGNEGSCTARINNAPTTYKESASAPDTRLHGGPFVEIFEASLTGSGWRMTRIAEQAS